MSAEQLEREMAALPDGGGPPALWEARVLARVRTPEPVAAPWRAPLVAALVGGVVLAVASVAFFAVTREQASRKERQGAARMESLVKELTTTQQDIDKLFREKDVDFQKLLAADTAEEKAAAQRALDAKNQQIAAKQSALRGLRDRVGGGGGGGGGKESRGVAVKCDPNDPLCGI
jgi:hypothetical protein